MIFNTFLTVNSFSAIISDWVNTLNISPTLFLIISLSLYLPLGMLMDAMAITILTLPIIFPIIINLGFDPVWYGILVAIAGETALLTPPVGLNVFIVHGVTNVPLYEIFRGATLFLFGVTICLALLIIFPNICLFLPNISN